MNKILCFLLVFMFFISCNKKQPSNVSEIPGTQFNPNLGYNQVVDIDGNTYKTINIGTQVWMAENLKVEHYQNGDAIPNFTDSITLAGSNIGSWQSPNNDPTLENPYGKLYNWYVVNDIRNVCPTGWHVPNEMDWDILTYNLDTNAVWNSNNQMQSGVAGSAMKSTGSEYWTGNYPNTDATNSSGFSALPAGGGSDGASFSKGVAAYFWTSGIVQSGYADSRYLFVNSPCLHKQLRNFSYGLSIRCVQD